ncbi:MAG TPA: transcription antitermination factor NusB [Elusimicrobia bacterium]|nr:transcription antitermination factor NusB [Elusimicrobiota bacterium]HBT62603.1 transcription antitermination factor NusB [Elusimicrobiota bacterium]
MGRRRQAREIALQALYLVDVANNDTREALSIVNRGRETDDVKTLEFARTLIEGAAGLQAEIDGLIAATAQNWPVRRMAAVDRNVLRLACYELVYEQDTPINVVIDEAIEIVRKYSTEDSTKFVNGILDKLKSQRPSPSGPAAHGPEQNPS